MSLTLSFSHLITGGYSQLELQMPSIKNITFTYLTMNEWIFPPFRLFPYMFLFIFIKATCTETFFFSFCFENGGRNTDSILSLASYLIFQHNFSIFTPVSASHNFLLQSLCFSSSTFSLSHCLSLFSFLWISNPLLLSILAPLLSCSERTDGFVSIVTA